MDVLAITLIYIVILIVFIFVIMYLIKSSDKKVNENPNVIKVNGVEIKLTDEEKEKIKQKELKVIHKKFIDDKTELLSMIKNNIKETDDIVRKKVLQELLKHPICNQADLDRLTYIYNSGDLRSNEEVLEYDKFVATEDKRKNYDAERHTVNIVCAVLPTIFGLVLGFVVCKMPIMNILISIILGSLFGFIGVMVGYKINIKHAEDYCISKDDPRLLDEKRKRAVGIAAGAISGVAISKHAKQAAKDFLNVDSWKELK